MQSFIVIAPAAANEAQFFYTYNKEGYLFVSQCAGMTLGALCCPIMADYTGRSWIFTSLMALAGVGGLVGAGMPAFTGLCILGFIVGFAIAGNQAVDAILLVESLPGSHYYLVAMQGAALAFGSLVADLIGWTFIEQLTCGTGPDETSTASTFSSRAAASSSSCHYVSNTGWRLIWWTFGSITLFFYLCRFALRVYESPKFLAAQGRDAEAVQVIKDIASINRASISISEAHFAKINTSYDRAPARRFPRLSPLFASLALLWTVFGVAFPLYNNFIQVYATDAHGVLATTATMVTTDYLFKRYIYISLAGILGPVSIAVLMEVKLLGRKYTGVLLNIVTGVLMLASSTIRSQGAWLGWQCALSFLFFAQLALLTVFTVESAPASVRGHALGGTMFLWRFFEMVIAIVVTFAGTSISGGAPVWFSGAITLVAAGLWVVCPGETHGRVAH